MIDERPPACVDGAPPTTTRADPRPSLRDLVSLYRVRDWIHFLPLPLAGWYAGDAHDARALASGSVGWMFALAYMSAINQAFDDRLDRAGKNPVGFRLTRRKAILFSLPAAAGSLVATLLGSPGSLTAAVFVITVATAYSAPPRLKRFPVLGTVWNAIIGAPGLLFADVPDVRRTPLRLLVGVFSLLLLASQLIHESEDRADDEKGGVATVAVLTGTRGALGIATALVALVVPATYVLAHGLRAQLAVTGAAGLFATVWCWVLGARAAEADASGLRRVRLAYRYAALCFGAVVFTAAAAG